MPIRQVPEYPDMTKLAEMEAKIGRFPPLVFAGEARRLKALHANQDHIAQQCEKLVSFHAAAAVSL
jgi:3-deoxy-D-arabino-heptulosonate 7-phosphate (DAHP) synthase class II